MTPKKTNRETSTSKQKAKKLKTSFIMEVKQEPPSDSDHEHEEEPEHEHEIIPQLPSKKSPITWPRKDMEELIRRIEVAIPSKDTITYKSRVEKLKWDEIAFGGYSADECKNTWIQIQDRVRRFRILREVIEDAKEWITKPWTHFYRGVKSNRHPDMPKRPLSSYMLFYLNKKDRVLESHPGMEMTDLSKRIAEMYKVESKSTKDKYNLLAAEQRREYEEKLEQFYRNHPEMVRINLEKGHGHGHGLGHGHDGPKKPCTPFKIFCEDRIKRTKDEPDFDRNLVVEQCKEQWKNMNDKKKVFWIDWALEEEGRYLEKVKTYKSENPDFVLPTAAKHILTKEERSIKERMAGKPSKPPNSAYSLFSRMMLKHERLKDVSPKERMHVISTEWKKLTENDKKEYQERVKHLLEQYKLDFATYLESLPDEKKAEELLNNQPKRRQQQQQQTKTSANKKQKTANNAAPGNEANNKKKKSRKKKGESGTGAGAGAEPSPDSTQKGGAVFEGEPQPPPSNASHKQKQEYIAKYEKFLKSLSPEKLQEYSKNSQWTQKMETVNESETDYSSSSSDNDDGSDTSAD